MSISRQLLTLLADGQYHSGQVLAQQLNTSRSTICKHVKQLEKKFALQIYAIKGKGYKLEKAIELFHQEDLNAAILGKEPNSIDAVHLLDKIDSTNHYLQQRTDFKFKQCQICVAEMQTAGQGRRGRAWVSPFAQNIYLSLSWRFSLAPTQLSGLSLVVGIALCRTLEKLGIKDIGLKWPNDVLHQHKKLAGILVEVEGEQEGPSHTVIGIGLNVDMQKNQADIDQPWVRLNDIADKPISRHAILVELIAQLVRAIKAFEQYGMTCFMQSWQKRDIYYDQHVIISSSSQQWEGRYKGIEVSGAMLLDTKQGMKCLFGGEVSLRPSQDS